MREHEVPTHVQAEDRVILWLTFPQIVAVTAVCALAYGAYRVAPFGPSGVRMALAAMMAAFGVAMIVGRVGGRRLPLVAADLLRFSLGPRVHAGPASELARAQPPPPPVHAVALPAGYGLMDGMFTVSAGATTVLGDGTRVSCPAGGGDCPTACRR